MNIMHVLKIGHLVHMQTQHNAGKETYITTTITTATIISAIARAAMATEMMIQIVKSAGLRGTSGYGMQKGVTTLLLNGPEQSLSMDTPFQQSADGGPCTPALKVHAHPIKDGELTHHTHHTHHKHTPHHKHTMHKQKTFA